MLRIRHWLGRWFLSSRFGWEYTSLNACEPQLRLQKAVQRWICSTFVKKKKHIVVDATLPPLFLKLLVQHNTDIMHLLKDSSSQVMSKVRKLRSHDQLSRLVRCPRYSFSDIFRRHNLTHHTPWSSGSYILCPHPIFHSDSWFLSLKLRSYVVDKPVGTEIHTLHFGQLGFSAMVSYEMRSQFSESQIFFLNVSSFVEKLSFHEAQSQGDHT